MTTLVTRERGDLLCWLVSVFFLGTVIGGIVVGRLFGHAPRARAALPGRAPQLNRLELLAIERARLARRLRN